MGRFSDSGAFSGGFKRGVDASVNMRNARTARMEANTARDKLDLTNRTTARTSATKLLADAVQSATTFITNGKKQDPASAAGIAQLAARPLAAVRKVFDTLESQGVFSPDEVNAVFGNADKAIQAAVTPEQSSEIKGKAKRAETAAILNKDPSALTGDEAAKAAGTFIAAPVLDPNKDYTLNNKNEQILTTQGKTKLHKSYFERVKPAVNEVIVWREKFGKLMVGLEKQTGSGDIAAINSFVRMIDDGVVRGEDIEIQADAVSLKERVQVWYKNKAEGDQLGDDTRANMAAVAMGFDDQVHKNRTERILGVKDIVDRTKGLEWRNVIPDRTWAIINNRPSVPKYIQDRLGLKTTTPPPAPPASEGYRQAPDGNWYKDDPARPGKFLQWVRD